MLEIFPCSFFVIPRRQLHRDEAESTLGCLISSTVAAHCKMISGISRKPHGLVQWYPSQQICVQEIMGSYLGWCRCTRLSRYVFRRLWVHIQVGVVVPFSVDMCSGDHWFIFRFGVVVPISVAMCSGDHWFIFRLVQWPHLSRYVFRRSLVLIQVGVVVPISVDICSGDHWFVFMLMQ